MQNPLLSQDIEACADSHLRPILFASILPFPPNSTKIMSLGRMLGSLSSTQPSCGGKPGWTQATELHVSWGLGGAPCPRLLSGATHCPWHHGLPESKGLFPSRRSCMWNAQQTRTTQADYNYKLKEKLKVPRLSFVFLSANCQLHEKLHCVFSLIWLLQKVLL